MTSRRAKGVQGLPPRFQRPGEDLLKVTAVGHGCVDGFGDVLLIRSLPFAHPLGFPSISRFPTARFSYGMRRSAAPRFEYDVRTEM